MSEGSYACHIVTGPAGAGKSMYSKRLAHRLNACLIDSDVATERLIRAGMALAGRDPDDRDSAAYKEVYRDAVYETLFDLATGNLPHVAVVLAGPFTREGGETDWPERLKQRLGVAPVLHFVWCDPGVRRARLVARGERRDGPKLAGWEVYAATCREARPVWPHEFVDTTGGAIR